MTRTQLVAAAAAAAAVGIAAAAVASAQAPADDPLLSPRMRELKRLRAELARLQAEIPRATSARKLAIDAELLQLDRKLEALQNAKDGETLGTIDGWTPLLERVLHVEAGRSYAAVVQLTGLASWLGTASKVDSKLREAAAWKFLQVYDAPPPRAAAQVPWTIERKSGRFWILGVPEKTQQLERPAALIELFERAS